MGGLAGWRKGPSWAQRHTRAAVHNGRPRAPGLGLVQRVAQPAQRRGGRWNAVVRPGVVVVVHHSPWRCSLQGRQASGCHWLAVEGREGQRMWQLWETELST